MAKKKVAVALSEWLLEEVDRSAEAAGSSRSALVEEALAEYVTKAKSRRRDADYLKRAWAAVEDMERFSQECADDPACANEGTTLERLRRLRATGIPDAPEAPDE